MGRFLKNLSPAGSGKRLPRVEVSGGLVEHQPSVDPLFDEKKAPVALDDGRDRHRRLPHHD
jgi:hypothetical protein